jgi:hypothetical protein
MERPEESAELTALRAENARLQAELAEAKAAPWQAKAAEWLRAEADKEHWFPSERATLYSVALGLAAAEAKEDP